MEIRMEEIQDNINQDVKLTAVCGICRHHQKNPTIEFNFAENKVYWLCQDCKNMNMMDLSKPLPAKFPKPRGI